MLRRVLVFLTVLLAGGSAENSVAVTLHPGDLIVTDKQLGVVFAIDPSTGERRIVSGAGVGEGPEMIAPDEIVIGANQQIYVDGGPGNAILGIDIATGDRRVITGPNRGQGASCCAYGGIALGNNGNLIAGNRESHRLISIDLKTGDRYSITDFLGQNFRSRDIALLPDGSFLVSNTSPTQIGIARRNSRFFEVLADNSLHEPGAILSSSINLVLLPSSELYATSTLTTFTSVLHVNLDTGLQSLVSGTNTFDHPDFLSPYERGDGPTFYNPQELAMGLDGYLYVADRMRGLYRVDPATGDRVLVSGPGVGDGPEIGELFGIAVVPVPEPTTLVVLLGLVISASLRNCRQGRLRGTTA